MEVNTMLLTLVMFIPSLPCFHLRWTPSVSMVMHQGVVGGNRWLRYAMPQNILQMSHTSLYNQTASESCYGFLYQLLLEPFILPLMSQEQYPFG